MPQKTLQEQSQKITKILRLNTLISGICVVAGFSLLIPAFSRQGSKFAYQEFCFLPQQITHPEQHNYCTGEKIRKGIAWRIAQEQNNNSQFKDKVTLRDNIPAQNPHAGVYGLCSAGFLSAAFLLFNNGTNQLEDNLDLLVWNKKSAVLERAFKSNQHIEIEQLKHSQESEFIKDIMSREHGDALYSLMSEPERDLAAQKHKKNTQLDQTQFDLQISTMNAQIAEQCEKKAKHKVETDKLNKPKKTDSKNGETSSNSAAKTELISKLKEHENGWLHTLCTSRKVLIIEGEQGSFKSYTAALIAYLRYQLKGHKIGWIVDSDYHQNSQKAWKILQSLEGEAYGAKEIEAYGAKEIEAYGANKVEAYGANKDGASIRQGMKRFLDGISIRDEDTCEIETIIFDELTTYSDYPECEELAKNFMKFALSAPRKAAYGLIAITHSLTNEGTGGGGGMAEARKRGALHLLLNADNDYNPTFGGILNGFKDDTGVLLEDMVVTLPDWFRPEKIVGILGK
jgi:hypothetical protein